MNVGFVFTGLEMESDSCLGYHLNPDIKIHFLLTVLHISLMLLVERICLKIKTVHLW